MTLHEDLHSNFYPDMSYVKKKESNRGLINIENCVQIAKMEENIIKKCSKDWDTKWKNHKEEMNNVP